MKYNVICSLIAASLLLCSCEEHLIDPWDESRSGESSVGVVINGEPYWNSTVSFRGEAPAGGNLDFNIKNDTLHISSRMVTLKPYENTLEGTLYLRLHIPITSSMLGKSLRIPDDAQMGASIKGIQQGTVTVEKVEKSNVVTYKGTFEFDTVDEEGRGVAEGRNGIFHCQFN